MSEKDKLFRLIRYALTAFLIFWAVLVLLSVIVFFFN